MSNTLDAQQLKGYLEYLDNESDSNLEWALKRELSIGDEEKVHLIRREMRTRGLLEEKEE